jgi:hypothetical protein
MAKRAPSGEEPYRPLLDAGVITAALTKASPASPELQTASSHVSDIRTESFRRDGRMTAERQPARSQPEDKRMLGAAPQMLEKLDQEKRMLLTRSESIALDRLVGSLASRVSTQVKLSHILRSLVTLILDAESHVDKRAGEVVGLMRPANGDFKAIQRFEREIGKILSAALRDSGPVRDD